MGGALIKVPLQGWEALTSNLGLQAWFPPPHTVIWPERQYSLQTQGEVLKTFSNFFELMDEGKVIRGPQLKYVYF